MMSTKKINTKRTSQKKINLIVSLYPIQNNDRKREVIHALSQNLSNHYIDIIYVLDEGFDNEILKHPKIKIIQTTKRPDFYDLLSFCDADSINIISNNDIYFDQSIKKIKYILLQEVFCLSRREKNGEFFRLKEYDSQDVWIVRGKVTQLNIGMGIHLGVPGCENRIAFEFYKAGYLVANPSRIINCWHIHDSSIRTYALNQRISKPYLLLRPVNLFGLFFTRFIQKIIRKYGYLKFKF
jgi:hypothetical protein